MNYYSVTVRITFGIMAESTIEAENIAKEYCQINEVPRRANIQYNADAAINQAESIRREAANYYD